MAISIYLADKLNDAVLRNTAYTLPTSVFIALFTSSGGLDNNTEGSQNELSGGAYARLEVGGSSGRSFVASSSKATTNTENWSFATATATWTSVSHTAVMDASTSGNVLFWGALATVETIEIGGIFRFLTGEYDCLYT